MKEIVHFCQKRKKKYSNGSFTQHYFLNLGFTCYCGCGKWIHFNPTHFPVTKTVIFKPIFTKLNAGHNCQYDTIFWEDQQIYWQIIICTVSIIHIYSCTTFWTVTKYFVIYTPESVSTNNIMPHVTLHHYSYFHLRLTYL